MNVNPGWNGVEWTCMVDAPAWSSLYARSGPQLEVVFLTGNDAEDTPPSIHQVAALSRFLERQASVRPAVEQAMREYYDYYRPRYLEFLEDPDTEMPSRLDRDAFERLHELQRLYVHQESEAPVTIGLSFRALWEIEHGFTHLQTNRVSPPTCLA